MKRGLHHYIAEITAKGITTTAAAALAFTLNGCGKQAADSPASSSPASTAAVSTESVAQASSASTETTVGTDQESAAEATTTAAAADTESGSDFAKVIHEESEESGFDPLPLTVGRLTLAIPGYYSLTADNSEGGHVDKTYTYTVGETGAALEIELAPASGITERQLLDSEEVVRQKVENTITAENVSLTKAAQIEYKDMPGYSFDFSGEIDAIPVTMDVDLFLDSTHDQMYLFRFVKAGEITRDVASDYGNMMKNATWAGKTISAKSEGSKKKAAGGSSKSASSGVNPNLKATLDSYEKVMDQYCDFMKKYQHADSSEMISMLNDYYKMLEEYASALDSINNLDTSNMSTADYQYYLDVTNRVSKKLLEVAQ